MIKKIFRKFTTYDISFYKSVQTSTEGRLSEPVETLYKTVEGVYWKTDGRKENISEKFRAEVSVSIAVDPDDIAESELETDMKITIAGKGDYKLVYPDDIAGQGKGLMLYCKVWS